MTNLLVILHNYYIINQSTIHPNNMVVQINKLTKSYKLIQNLEGTAKKKLN